jgi:hypothetical protein
MTDQYAPEETWRRCERCGFATALMSAEDFGDHECITRFAFDEAPTLQPIFHAPCGGIILYSKVPLVSGQPVPAPENLVLADGKTPLWTSERTMLLGSTPKSPNCPKCGGSANRALRTRPVRN